MPRVRGRKRNSLKTVQTAKCDNLTLLVALPPPGAIPSWPCRLAFAVGTITGEEPVPGPSSPPNLGHGERCFWRGESPAYSSVLASFPRSHFGGPQRTTPWEDVLPAHRVTSGSSSKKPHLCTIQQPVSISGDSDMQSWG